MADSLVNFKNVGGCIFILCYYIMLVNIENMRRENFSDRHGWKVDFSIENASKNTIMYSRIYEGFYKKLK